MELMGYYLAVVLLAAIAVVLISGAAQRADPLLAQSGAVAGAALLVTLVLSRFTRWSFAAQGWRRLGVSTAGFLRGTALGVAMAAGACIASLVFGARLQFSAPAGGGLLGDLVPALVVLLLAALGEELLFRGFPLLRLGLVVGKLRAALILSVVFALLHLGNPGLTVFGVLNLVLAGLVMSAAVFGPGGLAGAWGVHFGWNAGLGVVFEAPVSGVEFELPFSEYLTGGSRWITGGSFGPEGGLIATLFFAGLLWLWRERLLAERAGD